MIVALIVFIVVAAVVLWLTHVIVANLPIPPALRGPIIAVVALLLLLAFLKQVGWI